MWTAGHSPCRLWNTSEIPREYTWKLALGNLAVRPVILGSSSPETWQFAGRQRGGALLPEGSRAPKVEQCAVPYGSGTSAVTLPISSNSVFEVYSFTEIVP